MAHPFNEIAGSVAEEIHAYNEQGSIDDTRYQYPFPQFMFFNKPVGLEIRLYTYDHFFQQMGRFKGAKLAHSVISGYESYNVQAFR